MLVFKSHSLGGSSIASLSVSEKCIVAFAHAGWATCWALARFLVSYKLGLHLALRSLLVPLSTTSFDAFVELHMRVIEH